MNPDNLIRILTFAGLDPHDPVQSVRNAFLWAFFGLGAAISGAAWLAGRV